MSILVFIEHKDCQLNKASLEAIAAAQAIGKDLGLKITAVIPCDKDCSLAQEIAQYTTSKKSSSPKTKSSAFTRPTLTPTLEQIIKANESAIRRHGAHLSGARFCAESCRAFRQGSRRRLHSLRERRRKTVFTRRIFLGKLDADVTIEGDAPYFVTFQSGAYRGDNAAKGGSAQIETSKSKSAKCE
jgi:electron transfer flavoprotein alpha subunit